MARAVREIKRLGASLSYSPRARVTLVGIGGIASTLIAAFGVYWWARILSRKNVTPAAIRHPYGSNFQPFVNNRDVKDGKDEDLTAEPEMIKAFRDTWELGIHSYLSYLRDRLLLVRVLFHESG
jgi:hypothetical protein